MSEQSKPILFSTPMVQAILDGRKTMTRRVIKFPEGLTGSHQVGEAGNPKNPLGLMWVCGIKRPKYQPGDILWVRETWRVLECKYVYRADDESPEGWHLNVWRPSIFMPREAARIFLRVTDVRVERLKEITEADAKKEGTRHTYYNPHVTEFSYKAGFAGLWDSINVKRGYGWETNPWVFVYKFERVEL